jgi:hypothetical protein
MTEPGRPTMALGSRKFYSETTATLVVGGLFICLGLLDRFRWKDVKFRID